MTPCEHEARIVRALRDGRLTPDLEAHAAACADCREVAETVRAMGTLADQTLRLAERRRLPEASQLWWKGQLARRWEAEARAMAPLDRMQRIEVAAGVLAALVLLATFFSTIGAEATGMERGDVFPALAGLVSTSSLTWAILIVCAAATASLVMVRRLLTDQ